MYIKNITNKEELLSEIELVMERGLPYSLGGDVNKRKYCSDLLDTYVSNITTRLRADFENEIKQIRKEHYLTLDEIRFDTLSKFTEVLDNLQFFRDVVEDSKSEYVKSGFLLLDKKIDKFLRESKIRVVNTDCMFDSNLHECVSLMDEKKEKGMILKVVSRGYSVKNKIIKYPKVIVQS